jgi:hypothetical protein
MKLLEELDPLIQDMSIGLALSIEGFDWLSVKLSTRVAPVSEVSAQECELNLADGKTVEGWYPENSFLDHLRKQALRHWRLAQELSQPRWYKMIVTVERSGKFNVEFEYKDDYQEGDIMKRG